MIDKLPSEVRAVVESREWRRERRASGRVPCWPEHIVILRDGVWEICSGRARRLKPQRLLAALDTEATLGPDVRVGDIMRFVTALPPHAKEQLLEIVGPLPRVIRADEDWGTRPSSTPPGIGRICRAVASTGPLSIGTHLVLESPASSSPPPDGADMRSFVVRIGAGSGEPWCRLMNVIGASLRASCFGQETSPPRPSQFGTIVLTSGGPRVVGRALRPDEVLSAWNMRLTIGRGATLGGFVHWIQRASPTKLKAVAALGRFKMQSALRKKGRAKPHTRHDRLVVGAVEMESWSRHWVQVHMVSSRKRYGLMLCSLRSVADFPLSMARRDCHELGIRPPRPFEISLGDFIVGIADEFGFMKP